MLQDISKSIRRVDAISKCDGTAQYISDYKLDEFLWAKMVRSTVARGLIKDIKVPDLPDGYFFISAKDIPSNGVNNLHMITDDWRCFAEGDVKFIGETIGLIVGPDKKTVVDLVDKTQIEYEILESVHTMEDSLALKGGPQLNGNNIHCELNLKVGDDVDEVFGTCSQIIEETFETGYQEHIYLETNSACCYPENGKFVIKASCQCPYYILDAVAPVLGLSKEQVIVQNTTTGGGFGGKENFPDVLCGPLLVAAYVTKKGVKMFYDREEDIENSVKRHPCKVHFKTGLDEKGNIKAIDVGILYNVGAYMSSSIVVLQRGCSHVTGVYDFPNVRINGKGVFTNNFPSCAFRGFGAPQTIFAIESHLSHIALKFGIDPVEYKKLYFLKKGGRTSTNGKIIEEVKLLEMLEQVKKASDYDRKVQEYKEGSGKGIGIAFYNHGGAFTGNGEKVLINAKCILKKYKDGCVEILCSQTEIGQGFHTVLPKIAAKVLEIPFEKIIFRAPDTSRVPNSGPTVASRSTMIVGRLVEKAALLMKERYSKEDEFEVCANYEQPDGYEWDQEKFQGYAYLGYGWGVCAVEVEVDPCTGEVFPRGVWSSHDVGHVMDELIATGQVNGGVIQGLGWASTEVMENVDGRFEQNSLAGYIIPTSMDYPMQGVYFVENPYQWGPFGAKGMGELVFNGSGAAYIDAVSRAIGKKINKIPCPTEEVMMHMINGIDIKGDIE